jgi:hypothetical protein
MEATGADVLDENNQLRPQLYRSMAGEVAPEIGDQYARQLGVRLLDVAPYGEHDLVSPQSPLGIPIGMSVTTNVFTMYRILRPKFLPGGEGGRPAWFIYLDQLPVDLIFQPHGSNNDPNHGVISPIRCMPLEEFRKLIHETQRKWRKVRFMDGRTIS